MSFHRALVVRSDPEADSFAASAGSAADSFTASAGSAADFGARFDALLDALDADGMPLIEAQYRESAHEVRVWLTSFDGATKLLCAEDFVARVQHFEVVADVEAEGEHLCAALAEHFTLIDHDALLRALASGVGVEPQALLELAYGAPLNAHAPTLRLLSAVLLEDEREALRRAAATALGVLAWPEARPWLGLAYALEPPGEVRVAVARALAPFTPLATDFRELLATLASEAGFDDEEVALALASIEVSAEVQAALAAGVTTDLPLAAALIHAARAHAPDALVALLEETREHWVSAITVTMGPRPQRLDGPRPVLDERGRVLSFAEVEE